MDKYYTFNTVNFRVLIKTSYIISGSVNIGLLKFMLSKKATKIDEILTVDLTVTTYGQIEGEDFVNFCGFLRKCELHEHYENTPRLL